MNGLSLPCTGRGSSGRSEAGSLTGQVSVVLQTPCSSLCTSAEGGCRVPPPGSPTWTGARLGKTIQGDRNSLGERGGQFGQCVEEKREKPGKAGCSIQLQAAKPSPAGGYVSRSKSPADYRVIALHLLCKPFKHEPGLHLTPSPAKVPGRNLRIKGL